MGTLHVDSTQGTVPVGALWGRLQTVSRAEHGDHYVHRTVGRIRYDPIRGDELAPWWCLALTDPDIPEYYRWWVKRIYGIQLDPPGWGSHVSVVRGEPPRHRGWGYYEGHEVDISYTHDIRTNGRHFWLDVYSEGLDRVRGCLGFPPGGRSYHITVGRTPDRLIHP